MQLTIRLPYKSRVTGYVSNIWLKNHCGVLMIQLWNLIFFNFHYIQFIYSTSIPLRFEVYVWTQFLSCFQTELFSWGLFLEALVYI